MSGKIHSTAPSSGTMKQAIFIIVIFFLGPDIFSQSQVFDSIYSTTVTEVIFKEPDQALQNTEYLFKIAPDVQHQIKSLLLKSEIFRISGLHSEAIYTLTQADSMTAPDDFQNNLLINGLLATNYRESGQPFFSKNHLQKSLEIINKINDKEQQNLLFTNIYQEISYSNLEEKNYEQAIEDIRKSTFYLNKVNPENPRFGYSNALNFQILGNLFLKNKQLDSALYYSNKALEKLALTASKSSSLRGYIIKDLIDIAILSEDYKTIESLADEAIEISIKANDIGLRKNIYASLMNYYKKTENHTAYIAANEEYLNIDKTETANKQKARQDIYSYLERTQSQSTSLEASKTDWKYVYIGGSILLIALYFHVSRKNKNSDVVESLAQTEDNLPQKNLENHLATPDKALSDEPCDETQKEYLSEEAMQQILLKLKQLEEEEFYLNSNLSIGSVAAKVGVNHRYLSYTINRKYKKDFTTYINELRIEYIINFLKENPQHLRYKISYLADKAGFSSHNRFSAIFKKTKGISPSELIQQLEEETQQA